MNNQQCYLLAGVFLGGLLMITAQSRAEDNPVYFGLKAGTMNANVDGFGTSNNFGLLLGSDLYRDDNGILSVEGEYTHKISDGDVSVGGQSGNWKVETLGVYGAYRTAGDFYVKAKVGYLREDVSIIGVSNTGLAGGSDAGISYGAGVGYRFNRKAGLELEYTAIDSDISFLSLGYYTHF